jgi:hypothetical protein
MSQASRSIVLALALVSAVGASSARADDLPQIPDAQVEEALAQAGENRAQIQAFLDRQRDTKDPKRWVAARFLVANMTGKGFVPMTLRDPKGTAIPFDAPGFPSLDAAQKAYDDLEKAKGKIDFAPDKTVLDLETLSADFLSRHVDAAFAAWEGSAPKDRVSFDVFLNYVLPYRGSEEAATDWLPRLRERYAAPPKDLGDAPDRQALFRWLSGDAGRRVRFDDRYYLHPTDQSFDDLESSGRGRCEDITNMTMYAARSRALAVAMDYTPAWAHRDNNHAWTVLLGPDGRGMGGEGAGAAKVYRKTFAIQRGNLAFRLPAGREAPNRFLASKNTLDVSDQYSTTVDWTVPSTDWLGETFAYACVFNGGEWVAIDWAEVAGGKATFRRLRPGLLYLPAVQVGKTLKAIAPPAIVGDTTGLDRLAGLGPAAASIHVGAVDPFAEKSPDGKEPATRLAEGTPYVLKRWDVHEAAWHDVSEQVAGKEPLEFRDLPRDGLYWLVAKEYHRLERPFTIEAGKPRFW